MHARPILLKAVARPIASLLFGWPGLLVANAQAGGQAEEVAIRVNQIGYYSQGDKIAVVSGQQVGTWFFIKDVFTDSVVFTGKLDSAAYWPYSHEWARQANFSAFTTPGRYVVQVQGVSAPSASFAIGHHVLAELSKASAKAFYFNRASAALPAQFAEHWQRAAGHPDTRVLIHHSAATPARPAGTVVASSKGWYDAGDYNCYVVNSGITMHSLLSAYEHFASYFDTLNLHIPESQNHLPDLLDEAKWNLDWMLTMQDPNDGGVYHKKTTAAFCGAVMPQADTATRYLVAKSTAASFDFAAVMAMAYRVYHKFEPAFARRCLQAAKLAYAWGLANPAVYFKNPPGISTAEYGDRNTTDEREWAATELYISTNDDGYYAESFKPATEYGLPSWANVRTLGLLSLAYHKKRLTPLGSRDTSAVKEKIISFCSGVLAHKNNDPYGTCMGKNGNADFNWGGNSNALNYSVLSLMAYQLTGQHDYLSLAVSGADYVLGRNATGYCFVTGFGTRQVMHPHHRPSFADGVTAPVPGWLAGGPNTNAQQDCGAAAYPSSAYRAISYIDNWCSYSTNEVAINWNAPLVYVAGALQVLMAGKP